MKVVFISRATLYSNPGGDTIQITSTAQHLNQLGITADIRLTNENIDYNQYDLLHFFNIIRPADILQHIERSGKPYVVSTIFVDYYEFEKKNSGPLRKLLATFFSPDGIEYLKVLARAAFNKEKLVSPFYIWHGQKSSIKKIISGASMLLPNSNNEYIRLLNRYTIQQKFKIVPNGINTNLFKKTGEASRDNNLVLCVARIEPLKNQLLLIRALNNSAYKLLIIGKASVNQKKYYEKCREEAAGNVSFIDHVSQQQLTEYYAKAKVHVLPSWFETTGLSSLEAAACGCNIVITDKGDQHEYFRDYAYYCDPGSHQSIAEAIRKAANDPVNHQLSQLVSENYTWQKAAEQTAEAYREILSTS